MEPTGAPVTPSPLITIHFRFRRIQKDITEHWYHVPRIGDHVDLGETWGWGKVVGVAWFDQGTRATVDIG